MHVRPAGRPGGQAADDKTFAVRSSSHITCMAISERAYVRRDLLRRVHSDLRKSVQTCSLSGCDAHILSRWVPQLLRGARSAPCYVAHVALVVSCYAGVGVHVVPVLHMTTFSAPAPKKCSSHAPKTPNSAGSARFWARRSQAEPGALGALGGSGAREKHSWGHIDRRKVKPPAQIRLLPPRSAATLPIPAPSTAHHS